MQFWIGLQVVRGTLNPEFEETFEFIVPREEFEARYEN